MIFTIKKLFLNSIYKSAMNNMANTQWSSVLLCIKLILAPACNIQLLKCDSRSSEWQYLAPIPIRVYILNLTGDMKKNYAFLLFTVPFYSFLTASSPSLPNWD